MADLVIPVGYGLWQFETTHATIAHKAVTTLGFKVLTPPYTGSHLALALAAFFNAVKPLHDAEVTYTRAVALVGNDGPPLRFEVSGSGVGTRTTQVIFPPNVTYLIKKTSAFAGRRYRGRMYIPWVSGNDAGQTGQLVGAAITLIQTAATTLLSSMVTTPLNTSELSLLHSESPLSATPAPTPIVNLFGETIVATQRRRLERS